MALTRKLCKEGQMLVMKPQQNEVIVKKGTPQKKKKGGVASHSLTSLENFRG